MTLDIFMQGPSVYIPFLLISLVLTLIGYGTFPLLLANIQKKSITAKKYRTICFCFNFLVLLGFFVLGDTSPALPWILWSSVFSSFGVKILIQRGVLTDSVHSNRSRLTTSEANPAIDFINGTSSIASESSSTYNNIQNVSPQRYCKLCGGAIARSSRTCQKCGKRYFRITKYGVIICCMIVLIASLIIVLACQDSRHKSDIQILTSQIDALESDLSAERLSTYEKLKEIVALKRKLEFYDEYIVFVSDDGTSKYHKLSCENFDPSYFWAYNVERAEFMGYIPCDSCCSE